MILESSEVSLSSAPFKLLRAKAMASFETTEFKVHVGLKVTNGIVVAALIEFVEVFIGLVKIFELDRQYNRGNSWHRTGIRAVPLLSRTAAWRFYSV